MLQKAGLRLKARDFCYTRAIKHEKKNRTVIPWGVFYLFLRVITKLAFLNKKIMQPFLRSIKILRNIFVVVTVYRVGFHPERLNSTTLNK